MVKFLKKYSIKTAYDKKKLFRGTIQLIILIAIAIMVINAFLKVSKYIPYKTEEFSEDNGFICVSYSNIDRSTDKNVISEKILDEQLAALYESGYVTITQKDILDYYNNKKLLPPKSLFLFFENNTRKTSIFAQNVMEKYNMKATIFSLANSFTNEDPLYLSGKDMIKMEESTYWELGARGFRMEYINVFEDSGKFNHYLMDYIRDIDGIPLENYNQMQERITKDYNLMSLLYNQNINKIPLVYALISPNTQGFGTNKFVSQVMSKIF